VRALLALSFIAFISLGLPDGLLGVAWPSMRESFGLPLDALGALFVSGTLGYMSASFFSGAILRRIGLGDLLALSCLATAVTLLAYSVAPRWEIVVAFGLLVGLGAGAIDSGLNSFAAHNYSPRIVNMLHAFYGLGTTMGPVLMTTVLLAGSGWQRGYVIVGAAQLMLASAFIATRRLWPATTSEEHSNATRASLGTTLRLPAMLLSAGVFILYCGLEASTGAWLYTLLREGRDVATPLAGTAVSIYWGSLMAARIVFGLVHVGGPLSRWLFGCMSAILIATVALSATSNATISLIAAAIIGFACGPIFPWLISQTPERLGAAHGANAIGVQIASAALGLSLLPTMAGIVGDTFGVNAIPPVLIAIAVLLLAGFWVLEKVSVRRSASSGPAKFASTGSARTE
jgi:fucose permease